MDSYHHPFPPYRDLNLYPPSRCPHGHHGPAEIPVVLANGSVVIVDRTTGASHMALNPSGLARPVYHAPTSYGNESYVSSLRFVHLLFHADGKKAFPPTPPHQPFATLAHGPPANRAYLAGPPRRLIGHERPSQTVPTTPSQAKVPIHRLPNDTPKFRCEACGKIYRLKAYYLKHVCPRRPNAKTDKSRYNRAPNSTNSVRAGNTEEKNIVGPAARLEIREILIREGRQNLPGSEEEVSAICDEALSNMLQRLENLSRSSRSPTEGTNANPKGTPQDTNTTPDSAGMCQSPDSISTCKPGTSQATNPDSGCETELQTPRDPLESWAPDIFSMDDVPGHDDRWDEEYLRGDFESSGLGNLSA